MVWGKSEKKQTWRYTLASGIGIGILAVMSFVSPWIYGADDPLGFFRQLFPKSGPMLIRGFMAAGIVLYFDFISTTDWMDQIGNVEYGPTIFLSTIVYSVLCGG